MAKGPGKVRARKDSSRRTFLKTVGTGLPTLAVLLQATSNGDERKAGANSVTTSEKFAPIDLSSYFNASPADFRLRAPLREEGVERRRLSVRPLANKAFGEFASCSHPRVCTTSRGWF